METMKPRMMEPRDEPHVLTMVATALSAPRERLAILGSYRVPMWAPVPGSPRDIEGFPRALNDREKELLAKVGVGVTVGGVWLDAEALKTVAQLATSHRADVSMGATPIGVSEAGPMVPPEQGNAQRPQRFAEAMKEIAKPILTALEAQRERDEQQALAMIRERRRPGESEPETLTRMLGEPARFYPALDDDTPQVVRRCSGRSLFEAAAQLAHYITFEAPKLKGPGAPSAPQAEWMRSACLRANPTYQGDLIDWVMDTLRKLAAERDHLQGLASAREGCATAWGEVVDLLGPLAEDLDDNLGHEGPIDVLRRLLAERTEAEEHDLEAVPRIDLEGLHEQVVINAHAPPMTLETARDVVRFLNARLSGLDFDTCEEIAAYIERITKEQHDLKAEVSKVRATFMPGGAYRWENDGVHRLFHDGSGALCYKGPGVNRLVNNRAHPLPGKRPVLFDDDALQLIASIVNIARDAARETWLARSITAERNVVHSQLTSLGTEGETPPQTLTRVLRERAQAQARNRELHEQLNTIWQGFNQVRAEQDKTLSAAMRLHGVTSGDLLTAAARKLRELAAPFVPVGDNARNAFIASLAGKSIATVGALLASRVFDTDAAADALGKLYPNMPVSFAGLADVASDEIRQRRAERAESEGTLGRIAETVGLSRQAPGDVIEREVKQMRDALQVAVIAGQRWFAGDADSNKPVRLDGMSILISGGRLKPGSMKKLRELFEPSMTVAKCREPFCPRKYPHATGSPGCCLVALADDGNAIDPAHDQPPAPSEAIPVGVESVKVYVDPGYTTGAPPAPDPKPAP